MSANFVCGDLTCSGCGACVEACPFHALSMKESGLCCEPVPTVDPQIARIVGDVMLFAPHALPSSSGSPKRPMLLGAVNRVTLRSLHRAALPQRLQGRSSTGAASFTERLL